MSLRDLPLAVTATDAQARYGGKQMVQISTILDYIDNGYMALPEFQRGYVWNGEQVRALFRSLYLKRPVGGLLVWTTESSGAQYRGDAMIAPGIVKLLLDGQQRITSLYLSLIHI